MRQRKKRERNTYRTAIFVVSLFYMTYILCVVTTLHQNTNTGLHNAALISLSFSLLFLRQLCVFKLLTRRGRRLAAPALLTIFSSGTYIIESPSLHSLLFAALKHTATCRCVLPSISRLICYAGLSMHTSFSAFLASC